VRKAVFAVLFIAFLTTGFKSLSAEPPIAQASPSVLVLYDGPDIEKNPGRLDARYLVNLLGHFTTLRTMHPLESYERGEWAKYDAVFVIVYQRKYRVPTLFLDDIVRDTGTVCWLGNQIGQLDRQGFLQRHGIAAVGFSDRVKLNIVTYKGHRIPKGDPETNFLEVTEPDLATVMATVEGPVQGPMPYAIQSGHFWVFADSPFSYSSENDRVLVFSDLLHDILGILHAENHPALLRIEDINALSKPEELEATLRVLRKFHIPFSFGFVPMYVNPQDRLEFRMADKPDVVNVLQKYVEAGGAPVLHGYTHQYRGVTTDDYEFWDDLSDRPVRGDSEAFATRRVTEAIKESMGFGIYPLTWETPHYAASATDYKVFHRFFNTVYERRIAGPSLDSDQSFPYPVIDTFGQYIIPESLAYIPIDDQRTQPILDAADSMSVVRDGYASFFFHPFLNPKMLEELIAGVQKRGFHFVDLRQFPNSVQCEGRVIQSMSGTVQIAGNGHYLNEYIYGPHGRMVSQRSTVVDPQTYLKRQVNLAADQTYVAMRQDVPAPSLVKRLFQVAKGDLSGLHRRLGSALAPKAIRNPVKTIILWNSKARGEADIDQKSFLSAFTSLGYDVDKIDYTRLEDEDLGPFSMLVIPWATAKSLPQPLVERISLALNGGIILVTDGESPLSQALGIQLGPPEPVDVLQDHLFVNQDTRWPDKPSVPWISQPSGDAMDVYYSDRDSGHPLVISRSQREGRYLYFAPLFDSLTGEGYGRFPNLPQILIDELRVTPLMRRQGADVYFEPGYRANISIEVLAKMWRRFGIRAVHVGAWHSRDKVPYDYPRLVKVAHQNGILVYAWFEWPHVDAWFWEHHPAWREKTAFLSDAHVDWRYLMNLSDPHCMKAVLEDMRSFMMRYDWDGIDVGELTFESLEGPGNPAVFTPFNDQVRHEFQALEHFDPVDLFKKTSPFFWEDDDAGLQAFYRYRRDLNGRLLNTLLHEIMKLKTREKRHWEVIVTMLDALQHPELSDYLGIDVPKTVSLVNEYDATLQAEDPSQDWLKPPSRYDALGEKYRALPLKSPFLIDINVLSVHPSNQRGFATALPTGMEVVQLWQHAAAQAPRVTFYAESTVSEHDWEVMPYAMASKASVHRDGDNWIIDTPNTIRLETGRDTRRYRLDGNPWFCADKGEVIIPQGQHSLSFSRVQSSWFDTSQLDTYLMSITGELLGSQRVRRGLEIEYRSAGRCAMMFSKSPFKIYLDDESSNLSAIRGDDGYTVLAPAGQHRLRVISETAGLYAVEFTSVVTASLIVIFGLASSGLLAFLFLFVTLNRRTSRIRRLIWRRLWGAKA